MNRFRRLVEAMLPWYDPEAEAQRDARSESIHRRSIDVRVKAERVGDSHRRRTLRP